MATHHRLTMTTTGNNTGIQRHCVMKPTFFTSNYKTHLSATYYKNTTHPHPTSHPTPPWQAYMILATFDNIGILLEPPYSCVLYHCDISTLTLE
jgi:hypothetical protein